MQHALRRRQIARRRGIIARMIILCFHQQFRVRAQDRKPRKQHQQQNENRPDQLRGRQTPFHPGGRGKQFKQQYRARLRRHKGRQPDADHPALLDQIIVPLEHAHPDQIHNQTQQHQMQKHKSKRPGGGHKTLHHPTKQQHRHKAQDNPAFRFAFKQAPRKQPDPKRGEERDKADKRVERAAPHHQRAGIDQIGDRADHCAQKRDLDARAHIIGRDQRHQHQSCANRNHPDQNIGLFDHAQLSGN